MLNFVVSISNGLPHELGGVLGARVPPALVDRCCPERLLVCGEAGLARTGLQPSGSGRQSLRPSNRKTKKKIILVLVRSKNVERRVQSIE